jgi:(E)-4-hydroxy-3-methylbut-2-enyl-diphosphate synthase
MLAERYFKRSEHDSMASVDPNPINPFEYEKQHNLAVLNIGGNQVPRVVADLSHLNKISRSSLSEIGYDYIPDSDKWNIGDTAADLLYIGDQKIDFNLPGTLNVIRKYAKPEIYGNGQYPFLSLNDCKDYKQRPIPHFLNLNPDEITKEGCELFKNNPQTVLVLETKNQHAMPHLRAGFMKLINGGVKNPVIIKRDYIEENNSEKIQLHAATDFGGLFNEGLGQGIWINAPSLNPGEINQLAFGILQATRTRISRTDYISCPSCGRTLFDLQTTTAKIRARTEHLKGLKIGIMGCIVNGPGEMADADYGYVGSGPGVITLYKEKEVVQKNIPAEEAVDELIGLIKKYGDWMEVKE